MQIYRLKDRGVLNGWIHRDEKGKPLIELAGLREHLCAWSRSRIDSFHGKPVPAAVEPEPAPTPVEVDADLICGWANGLLDPASWAPPPWSPVRWASLLQVWAEAEELAAEHGPFSEELLAQLEGSDDD